MFFRICVCVFRCFSLFRQHLSWLGFFFLSQFQSHKNTIKLIPMRADAELCNHLSLSGRELEVQGECVCCIAITDSPRHLPCTDGSVPVSEVVWSQLRNSCILIPTSETRQAWLTFLERQDGKLEVNRISVQQYFYLKEIDFYPVIGTIIKMLKCIFLSKNP